ncbi:tRNA ligase [Paracoccidioides lutzii Pb01]|uniref:tRNA ligase n=1 Tax=Paracoccidioides lutzii (strain ATCC MYA-826 / Pb01) TaxID=502779 RepID=C1GWA6_PARBA|nr:tRNA ligase [Paracoccidioides lutzii Pb01]EEH40825.1 tRNA ligase [Paracoccidioides lutzii Pb01]
MVQQDIDEVAQLVHGLEAASGSSRRRGGGSGPGRRTFSCKKSTFLVQGSDNISVDSWRFQDWDYKRDDLPTYARGLFTTRNKNNNYEIAIRGYDKFFNVDEVDSTRWRNIETNTIGPYELSVKENGCIIFISGLEDGTLLVCSKHSTGARTDVTVSHAVAGENWVRHHVASVGKTVGDLAKALRSKNLTAVGELCDDHFEEHVLAYDEQAAGIYLHGLNYNVPQFATLPGPDVHKFADEWGFKKAQYLMKDSLSDVKTFVEKCAETGSWDGRDTEGFVIRCQISEGGAGPYRDWFFKYKFEEPYLMYRQWREATKAMIAGRQLKLKKHVAITEEYLHYAKKRLVENPQLAKLYNQNHGIIAMRDGFLKERGLKGSEIIAMESDQGEGASSLANVTQDVVLVPVASIGCGKTTLALALVKLFGWGHIQNDNIQGPKNRPKRFAQEVNNSLVTNRVVIADRNNHQKRERKQIMEDVQRAVPKAKFVALHYVHEPKEMLLGDIRQVTQARVLERGDNHQTIQANSKGRDSVIAIMEGFLNRFEAVNIESEPDYSFDEVIDLNVMASSRENLEKVISVLHSTFPKLMNGKLPTSSELDDAIDEVMKNYKVETKHDLSFSNIKNSKPAPRETPDQLAKHLEYFRISLKSNEITNLLSSLFPPSTPPEKAKLYNHLRNSRRIQPSFHVTLIHRASQLTQPAIWTHYQDLYKAAIQKQLNQPNGDVVETPTLGTCRVRIERLVWDDRIMAFVVRICPQEGDLWPCANDIPHITVGTAAPNVKPKESNDLLKRWLEIGAGGETGIWEAKITSVTVLEGTVGEELRR